MFMEENTFEDDVWEMLSIFSRPQFVKYRLQNDDHSVSVSVYYNNDPVSHTGICVYVF